MTGPRVLIVGAGIAGSALARLLGRSGASLDVVEREPAWRPAGTGVYMPGNTARALRRLGLEEEVAARAVEIPRQRFYDHRGRLLCDVDVAALWSGVGPCLAVPRSELQDVLLAEDVPIRMGTSVKRLAQDGEVVSVELSDGTSGDYDLVVGADGIHSTVRGLAFGAAAVPRPVGQVAWRFLAPRPADALTWSVMLGRRAAFLTIPITDDQVYCYGDLFSPATERASSSERLRDLFSEFADPAATLLATLDGTPQVHASTIEEVALESCVQGRVVLVGDAAHATSPNMAQGAAMALEDALVLAATLGEAEDVPRALSAFERRRRPRTDWVRAQTHRRDRTRYLPPAIRNSVLRALGRRILHANYRPLLDQP